MRRYELNPKEKVKFETKPNMMAIARKNNRPVLIGTLFLIVLALFFWYVMQSIKSFSPLLVLIGLIAMAALVYYVVSLLKSSNEPDEKYIITNVRTLILDNDNNIKKEINNNSITKIVEEKVTGVYHDVVLNPKEETNPTKLRKNVTNKTLYTADTVILKAVEASKVKEAINK